MPDLNGGIAPTDCYDGVDREDAESGDVAVDQHEVRDAFLGHGAEGDDPCGWLAAEEATYRGVTQ